MNFIGIDLGTTNSVACTFRRGDFQFLKFSGKVLLPSAVMFKDGKIKVGEAAKNFSQRYPNNVITSAKTYMGDNGHFWEIDGRKFTATDVAAEVLREIYKSARKFFNNAEEISAVITVPEQFSANQRAETKKAGESAGFTVKQILTEPVAAAIAYAFGNSKPNEKIYVVDLGGGTFDVALLEAREDDYYKTLIQGGNRSLGGDDFDKALVNIMIIEIFTNTGVELTEAEKSGLSPAQYSTTIQKIYIEAEKVKRALSYSESAQVDIKNLFPYKDGVFDFHMTITREEFLREISQYAQEIETVIKNSFEGTEFSAADVDRVILAGGSAMMPFVRECVQKIFNKEPYSIDDLSKLVAMGAAIFADDTLGNGIEHHDIISHSFGVELVGKRMEKMLLQNEEYPCERTKTFYTIKDNQKAVRINAYEGEDTEEVEKNTYIGGFLLKNIELAPKGKEIEIRFIFDKNCILHVMAKDPKLPGVEREMDFTT